ncbi:MAG: nitronate monooxygenase [Pseudomonadota bacterium]
MTQTTAPRARVETFCAAYALEAPILLAPMAGACPPALAAAVANGGGMGACGALLMKPDAIQAWASSFRASSNGAFQINLWIPDPPAERDAESEARVRGFLSDWGPDVPDDAGDAALVDFDAQCAAMLDAGPSVVSSIMGLYPPAFVDDLKARNIRWFATATTVDEAVAAEAAGADAIVAQGMEAGGHRGAFNAEDASAQLVGLASLVPAIADAVSVPVIATGGIADGRGIAAALMLGASAVQVGTGFLRTPEAGIATAWADALAESAGHETTPTRAFSGRLGRALRTPYVEATQAEGAPPPAPYPVQRGLTAGMRAAATKANDIARMQAWAGQSAALARALPAGELTQTLWQEARALMRYDQ